MNDNIDAPRLSLILNELRLPTIKHLWPKFAERSDKEGWPAARFLAAIAEHEPAERDRRGSCLGCLLSQRCLRHRKQQLRQRTARPPDPAQNIRQANRQY